MENTKKMFTEDKLKSSEEFKNWVTGRVSLIHNTYHDSGDNYVAYIVLHSDMGKWTITRFFEMGRKIGVSVDHSDISSEEVFKLLLTDYSRGLA